MNNKSEIEYLTLGDLRKRLMQFPDTDFYNNMPLIYSSDDEGNNYSVVNFLLRTTKIKELKYSYIELIYDDDSSDNETGKVTEAIIIN